ncbi:MAG: SpvB/TcaC N-terminal domain-containing protein [Sandaracinaceae bacterium]
MTALRPMELLRVDPTAAVAAVQVDVDRSTGSPSVQVPVPLTPGRDGFGPSLALTFGGYDPLSPLAHGWSLGGLSAIDIDVREGLPRYDGTDTYRYMGQPLIPLDDAVRPTAWVRNGHDVRAFRLRIESAPLRVERWTDQTSGRIHWRVRTGDGAVMVYGRRPDGESRIADPATPSRTYRWLVESGFDRLGNAMLVRYRPEDAVGVDPISHDAARFAAATANRYPDRIVYGNAAPYAEDDDTSGATWYFETVFDYGDYDAGTPQPTPSGTWPVRADVAFTGRSGFEIRTRRLLRRVLQFHHFPTELGEASTLVGELELTHAEDAAASMLTGVRYVGWRKESGGRVSASTPLATFTYTSESIDNAFQRRDVPSLTGGSTLVDLFGEGIPGLLSLGPAGAWFAPNRGGFYDAPRLVDAWPRGLSSATIDDYDGDGNPEWVQVTGQDAGVYRFERRTGRWQLLKRFDAALNLQGAVVQRADITGDGRADIVLMHEGGSWVIPNRGDDGLGEPFELRTPPEKLPRVVLPLDRFVADMTGDGLADLVEVLNGAVRYWPNLGRGRFGDPVIMDGAPRLDAEGSYDAARVLLVDLDGSGPSDLVYLRGDGSVWRANNRRGTSFGTFEAVAWGAPIPNGVPPQLVDVNGDGSPCLTFFAPSESGAPTLHSLRLLQNPGARQIASVTHPLGATSTVEWGHSVAHYLRDVAALRGWETPLPTQRPVVDVLRRVEPIDGAASSERFAYHDGHYDPKERSFAMFAVVDHYDVDPIPALDALPALTRQFSHTGELDYASRFVQHHYAGDLQARPPPASAVDSSSVALLAVEVEDAWRALTGSAVRTEVYGADEQGSAGEHPFSVACSSQLVRSVRSSDPSYRVGVQVVGADTLTTLYEQSPGDPRESLSRVLDTDDYVLPRLSFQAGLTRRGGPSPFAAQDRVLATASTAELVHVDSEIRFEIGVPSEGRTYEVHVPDDDDAFDVDLAATLTTAFASANEYDTPLNPASTSVEARELGHQRTFYWNDTLTAALALGQVGAVTLPHHSDSAAYHRGQLTADFGSRVDPDTDLPPLGLLLVGSDDFYAPTPTLTYSTAATFHRLEQTTAYDSGVRQLTSDTYRLVMASATDEVGNTSSAQIDYHLLAPWQLTDPNGTIEETDYDPLGITRRTSRRGTAYDQTSTSVAHGFGALTLGAALPTFGAALSAPETELGTAESLLLYEYPSGGQPMRMLTLSAEQFDDRGPDAGAAADRAQMQMSYLDGFGRPLQARRRVEDGTAWVEVSGSLVEANSTDRWLVSGYAVYDDKQRVVATFEPFFRDGVGFEVANDRRQFGVSPTTTFDVLGRSVRQDMPNGTFSETVFGPWSQQTFDVNDTSDRASAYKTPRQSLPTTDPERIALEQALSNQETPVTVHVDPLGREIASVEEIESSVELTEEAQLEIRGLSEATIDRRGLTASTRTYDRLGRVLLETSMDAGATRVLYDALGRDALFWREDTAEVRTYDVAGRLTERTITDGSTTWLAERFTFGEGATQAADRNQLGRLIKTEDGAGTEEVTRYGAFGEILEVERVLTATPGLDPDWSGSVTLESTGYTSISSYDAAGRRVKAWLPDGTERTTTFLRSGPVETLVVKTPDLVSRTIVASAVYNARGQQTFAELGNVTVRRTASLRRAS